LAAGEDSEALTPGKAKAHDSGETPPPSGSLDPVDSRKNEAARDAVQAPLRPPPRESKYFPAVFLDQSNASALPLAPVGGGLAEFLHVGAPDAHADGMAGAAAVGEGDDCDESFPEGVLERDWALWKLVDMLHPPRDVDSRDGCIEELHHLIVKIGELPGCLQATAGQWRMQDLGPEPLVPIIIADLEGAVKFFRRTCTARVAKHVSNCEDMDRMEHLVDLLRELRDTLTALLSS